MQQQLLSGASGQLQAAAALLVELARAASAASLAAQGNPAALTANTAAVLRGAGAGQLGCTFIVSITHSSSMAFHARCCCPEHGCSDSPFSAVSAHTKGAVYEGCMQASR